MGVTRIPISGSSFGEAVLVSTTATTGVIVHQASTGATNTMDEVWLTGCNSASATHVVYLAVAGSTVPMAMPVDPLTSNSPVRVLAGDLIKSSTLAAKTILAYGTTSNVIALYGYVNRISS